MLEIPQDLLTVVRQRYDRMMENAGRMVSDPEFQRRHEENRCREEAVNLVREERHKELTECASAVIGWVKDFVGAPDCDKLIVVAGGPILLYADNFWNEMPCPDHKECCAGFFVGPSRTCHYSESAPGYSSLYVWPPVPIWKFEFDSSTVSEHLVARLHPEFLIRLAAHIKSGKVWDDVARAVTRIHR